MYDYHCAECGQQFESKAVNTRFCSGRCKSAYHYKKRRVVKIGDNIMDSITLMAVASKANPDAMVLESAINAIKAIKQTIDMYEDGLVSKLKEIRKAGKMKSAEM